uniref:Uncharacterized protein n=1 Tax=Wuchereria bancrofti TaxID=6293 RepID=A0A1I8EE33_WUCBA
MDDPKRTADTAVSSSDSGSGACDVETLSSPKESSNTNKELDDFPDLTDFVNQRTEDDLNELFSSRYTMANKLYIEVASGFPDPVIVCPWNKRPKRNFDYTGGQRRSWREDSGRNFNSEWRSGWRNPSYNPYAAHGSRKRCNADADHVRVSYPGRANP